MRIYLCGPINGCNDDEATTWREWFKMQGDFVPERFPGGCYVDPMKRDYRGKETESVREIVDLDKRDIKSCDFVVVMYVKPSVGTSMEILFAWTLGIPVIVINESGSDAPLSPWLVYHSTSIVTTKEEACSKLREWSK